MQASRGIGQLTDTDARASPHSLAMAIGTSAGLGLAPDLGLSDTLGRAWTHDAMRTMHVATNMRSMPCASLASSGAMLPAAFTAFSRAICRGSSSILVGDCS